MVFLLQRLADWALAASALGFLFGVLACRGERTRGWGAWLLVALILGLGAGADALAILPGRSGFWLEAGLIVLGSHALGCGLGCLGARLFRPRALQGSARQGALVAEGEQAAPFEASVAASSAPHAAPVDASESPAPAQSQEEFAPAASGDARAAIAASASAMLPEEHLERAQGMPGRPFAEAIVAGAKAEVDEPWAEQARLLAQGRGLGYDGGRNTLAGAPEGASGDRAPEFIAPQANDALYPGKRPRGTLSPPARGADDLTRIAGVDHATASHLQGLGIWTFDQISAWSADEARWVEFYLAAPGRARREKWLEQAGDLAVRAALIN